MPRYEAVLFWLLAAFLVLTALTGGSSRSDVLPLVILQPAAILLAAAAAWTIRRDDLRRCRFVLTVLLACFALTLAHLVPLPPAIWQKLSGRELVVAIDGAAGLGPIWRPISLMPLETRRSLAALFVPLAVLLTGAQLGRRSLGHLLLIVLGIALFSALLGLVQLVVPAAGFVFSYGQRIDGGAGGVFANRNHQAVFLTMIFPMLAAVLTLHIRKEQHNAAILGAGAVALLIVPLLLVTGSRAGLLLAVLALPLSLTLLRLPTSNRRRPAPLLTRWLVSPRAMLLIGAILVMVMVGTTVAASRALSLSRIYDMGGQAELRFKVWPVIITAISNYLPFGSGVGSFVNVFQVAEPDTILRPTYLNRAHSEVLEIALTAGIPGLALLLVASIGWVVAARRAFSSLPNVTDVLFAQLGVVMIGLLALGSLADYPLRTPLLTAVLTVAALWTSRAGEQSASWKRNEAMDETSVDRTEGSNC